nr:hypothetical protein [candidate division Zixibacteria bacterium]
MATLVDKYFSQADFDVIEAAVIKAESSTSGEIAVELASHSRNWEMERIIHALVFTLICMAVALYLTRENNWGIYYNSTQTILWGGIGFLVAYFGWGRFLRRVGRRRRIVWNRALSRFGKLIPIRGLAGILIFVSLDENQAALVADKGIASKASPDFWHQQQAILVRAMSQGKHSEGIIQTIESIAVELARHFPGKSEDLNQLPDRPEDID